MAPIQEGTFKPMIPHVGSQLQLEQLTRRSRDGKQALRRSRKSTEYLTPIPLTPRQKISGRLQTTPSLSQLATEGGNRWDQNSVRHTRQYSQDTNTPTSAVDSIFELPSGSVDSPNSSLHSSFVAELEDTSSIALLSNRPAFPVHSKPRAISPPATLEFMEFKSTKLTARAVIKVVDETIANIEAANRELLHRAEAAEEAARILREQNSTLQQRINEYNRPKTAPSQSSPRTGLRHRPSPSVSTPLSAFNTAIDQFALSSPLPRAYKPPPYPLHTRQISNMSSRSLLKPSDADLVNDPFTDPKNTLPPRRPPPLPLLPAHEISSPIPGTVMRHQVTYNGHPISIAERRARNISLEEARRREKPLPPLGPMSPSVLKGVVEIGTPKGVDEFGREIKMNIGSRDGEKRRRGLSGLFRRKVKESTF